MTNLAANLITTADAHPERPAVRLHNVTLTYHELASRAAAVAGFLKERGVAPGDRVGLMVPNVTAFPPLYYGILWAGAIAVPMNPLLKSREVMHCVTDAGMKLGLVHTSVDETAYTDATGRCPFIAVDDEALELAPLGDVSSDLHPADDSDTAVILYTSGTTGAPKGAELTHANLSRNAQVSVNLCDLSHDDVVMGCLPLFHAFGQSSGMNASVRAGALLTLMTRFETDEVLRVIERDHVTIFLGVPTMYNALLATGTDGRKLETLRLCGSGGASLPGEVLREFRGRFGAEILEGYGLSETSPTATFNHLGRGRVGSIGTPVEGVELKLVDENGNPTAPGEIGEIAIRGHNVMKGYWGRPGATASAIREGWFFTGDLARRDEDGYYYIVDRKKDLIIRGGYNVYPREIEELLYEHPDVVEAAVVGVPDAVLGQEVGAVVVLRPGARLTEQDISNYIKGQVAPYKYPRRVWFVEELPKGATGKILKREVQVPDSTAAASADTST